MKKSFCLVFILVLMVSFAACGQQQAPQPATTTGNQTTAATTTEQTKAAEGDIIIGNIQDLSSTTAVWGKSVKWGAEKAAEKINSEGGINGRKIKVISYDTKNDVNESITAYNRLVQQDKAVAIIGPPTSNIGIALAPIADDAKVAIFGDFMDERATTKTDGTPWKYMFLGEPSCNQQAVMMADYAIKKLNLKKFAILFDSSNAYAVSHAEPFAKYIKDNGGEIVANESFQKTDKDYRAQLSKIKNANPEAIYIPNYVQQDALAYQQARQMGITSVILGNNSFFVPFAALVKGEVKDVYFPNNIVFDDPKIKVIVDEYKSEIKEDPSLHITFGYDNLLAIAQAMKNANSTEPTAIRDALENLKDVDGLTGKISINPATHRPTGLSMYILKIEGTEYKPLEKYLPPEVK